MKAQSSLHTWTVYVGIYASSEGSEEPPYLDSLYRALSVEILASSEGSEEPPYLDSLYRAMLEYMSAVKAQRNLHTWTVYTERLVLKY